MITALTNRQLMAELGRRIKALRLQHNISVFELAERAGLNRNTVVNVEAGANPRLESLVRVLRALGRLEALDAFLPPPPVSPIALVKAAGRVRRRASRRRG